MSEETIDYGPEVTRGVAEKEETPKLSIAGGNKPASIQRAARKSEDVSAILKGVTQAYTPEEVKRLLKEAERIAKDNNSHEGLIAIVKLVLEYTVGKPVQRSISAEIPPEHFANWFSDNP